MKKRMVCIYTYTKDDLENNRLASKLVSAKEIKSDWSKVPDEIIINDALLNYCTYEASDIYDKVLEPEAFWDEVRHQREWVRGAIIECDEDDIKKLSA